MPNERIHCSLFGLAAITAALARPVQAAEWRPVGRIEEARLRLVAADARSPRQLFTASERTLYASEDGGTSWRACFQAPRLARFTSLALDPLNAQRVAAATTNGLYLSDDGGRRWRRVFRGSGEGEALCRTVAFHATRRDAMFVGTAGGAFVSQDGGRSWREAGGALAHHDVMALAAPGRLYALTTAGLFAGDEDAFTQPWQRLGEVPGRRGNGEDSAETDDLAPEDPEEAGVPAVRAMAVDPHDPQRLYVGTSRGLWISPDAGRTWQRASTAGPGSAAIQHLLAHTHSPTVVYAATTEGIARYRPEAQQWEPLTAGLPVQPARHLAAAGSSLLAATDSGLYQLDLTQEQLEHGNWPPASDLLNNFVREPTITQTQQAATSYADVEPQKILRWRRQASLQALLPTVSMGAEPNLTDFRHWDSGTNPDSLLRGERDVEWSTSVSWDLGELIWNDDQTSIDTRSRLLVQLRDDVLDDVTRTYFERRRIQVALLTDPPGEPKAQLDQELRLQELTARLDALTGGWFSEHSERGGRYGNNQ